MLFIAAALLVVHVVGTVGKHFIFHFSLHVFFLFSPHATKLLLFIWNLVSHSYRLFLRHQYMRDLNLLFHFYFTARPTYIHYFVAKLLHTNVFKYHKCSYLFTFYIKFCKKNDVIIFCWIYSVAKTRNRIQWKCFVNLSPFL